MDRAPRFAMDWAPGYRELAPPAALRPSVSCLWAGVAPPADQRTTVVLPDACVDLIWEQGVGAYVAGPDTGPAPATSPPGAIIAGVRFAPGAAGPALGMPMSALLDQRVGVGDLGSRPAAGLSRRLPGSLPPDVALQALIEVAGAMTEDGPTDVLAARAARLLGRAPVQAEAVAGRLEVSERQLRRRCQASVGYGPATLRRVLRFRRFVSWADAGARGGDLGRGGLRARLRRPGAPHQGLRPAGRADPYLPGRLPPPVTTIVIMSKRLFQRPNSHDHERCCADLPAPLRRDHGVPS